MRRAVLVYVGPGGDVIDDSSSGLVVDDHADGSVMLDGRHDEVIDSGHGDHVKCAGSAGHDLIYDTSTDSVAGGCHRHGDRVLPLSRLAPTITAKAGAAAQVTGDGSNANPFIAPCSDPQDVDCTVDAFPVRTLNGWFANEYVPAYRCPDDHPWLLSHNYVPGGTSLLPGVEIDEGSGTWTVGVSITGHLNDQFGDVVGTATGFLRSSATSWANAGRYKVILHCTSDILQGYVRIA